MSDAINAAWAALDRHWQTLQGISLRTMFADDPSRFDRHSVRLGDLLLDYSKCRVDATAMALLETLCEATGVARRRQAMFDGAPINETEGRAVLHVALRNRSDRPIMVDGHDVMGDVNRELGRALAFAEGVRTGSIAAADGGRFTDVINLGIGGSDLGPAMATLALVPYHDGPRVHYVSNVDSAHLADTLRGLNPARTLVAIASKTFTTIETMTNAQSARAWIVAALGGAAVGQHFAAMSTALDKVAAFGIQAERTFGFWDWVGGRYSLWSVIGLPLMIAVGQDKFTRLLDGAHAMDEHFRSAAFAMNLPMVLGALSVWHRSVCGYSTRAILPYDQRLARLPAHLQQLEMESNGKRVALDGKPVQRPTGAVIWGEPGTNGQHAFFQLLHQGTEVVPTEFMIAAEGHEPGLARHHRLLIANGLAQSEALAFGRTEAEAEAVMLARGASPADAGRLSPHRAFPGDRPSLTIAYRKLDPETLGRLIALYEHRVFVEAAIHGIDAFDQWGVELGKELATGLLPAVEGRGVAGSLSGSTRGLLAHLAGLY
jgi:glucose-6-phosphate isomerase